MLTKGVLHDNARPHVARDTKALLDKFGWDILPPPYSSNFVSSDYHLFTNLKKHICKKKLNSDEELKTAVKNYLEKEVNGGFTGIQKLLNRLQRASIRTAIMSKNSI